jgi:hypothetical protein
MLLAFAFSFFVINLTIKPRMVLIFFGDCNNIAAHHPLPPPACENQGNPGPSYALSWATMGEETH